jgi:hypothetical protein
MKIVAITILLTLVYRILKKIAAIEKAQKRAMKWSNSDCYSESAGGIGKDCLIKGNLISNY